MRETGASSLTPLKVPLSKESKDTARDKTEDVLKRRKLGKLGMQEHVWDGQVLSPAETSRYRRVAANANFHAIDRGEIMYCAKDLTREQVVRMGRYLKKGKGTFVVNVPGEAVPT